MDIEKLEKLSQLRASGMLTDEEFAAQKAKLLSGGGGGAPVMWISLGALVIVALAAAAVIILKPSFSKPGSTQSDTAASAPIPPPLAQPPAEPRPSGAATQSKIDSLFNVDRLGGYLPKFEAVAGLPDEVSGETRDYKVDGCEISVEAADKTIKSITLQVSENCQPNRVLVGGGDWTFDKVAEKVGGGPFSADCLRLCGNAYDPSVYMTIEGGHADNWLDIQIEAKLVGDPAVDAANKWETAMVAAEGEDYVIDLKFVCDQKYDDLASSLFTNVRITAVTIGKFLPKPKCD
jgi:hypothetical protein